MRQAISELAGTGVLRAGINMGNPLLVTGTSASGDPEGVAPDMAAEIARRLDVPVAYVKFDRPAKLADAAGHRSLGYRADRRGACAGGENRVHAGLLRDRGDLSGAAGLADSKTLPMWTAPGSRIAVRRGAAYDLWLTRNIKHATLLRPDSADGPLRQFVAEGLEALAALRPQLLSDAGQLPGTQEFCPAISCRCSRRSARQTKRAGAAFLRDFVAEAKHSGLVARLIEKHRVIGLSVAP